MKKYGDLDLKKIREACGLDFAHFTFGRNQCSCCYGPTDLPSIYWKDRKVLSNDEDYTYILFNNAPNGSGSVTKGDFIKERSCVLYHFKDSNQKSSVVKMLQEQLGDMYSVFEPYNSAYTIVIRTKSSIKAFSAINPIDISAITEEEMFELYRAVEFSNLNIEAIVISGVFIDKEDEYKNLKPGCNDYSINNSIRFLIPTSTGKVFELRRKIS